MEFNKENYPKIKQAYHDKVDIEFEAPREITAFAHSEIPEDWTAYPPVAPPNKCVEVFAYLKNNAKDALISLELSVYLKGGQVLYKKSGPDMISIKFTWPNKSS